MTPLKNVTQVAAQMRADPRARVWLMSNINATLIRMLFPNKYWN